MEIERCTAVVRRVRAMPGVQFFRREVADALAVSPATLRRLARHDPELGPTDYLAWGGLKVALYDEAVVERLHAHLAEHRSSAGRPRLWSDEQRRVRRARHSAVGYRRRRAQQLGELGDRQAAERLLDEAERLSGELRRDHQRRSEQPHAEAGW